MIEWNQYTEHLFSRATSRLRRHRVELFVRTLRLGPTDTVLDLGSEDGSYLASHYPYPHNIVLADIIEEPMRRGVARYGLKDYVLLSEDGPLPLEDRQFDAVWCNSVLEHATLPRTALPSAGSKEFRTRAECNQRRLSREIARVGKMYFVQTPYVHFPIEAHAWLPFVQYLSQRRRWSLSRRLKTIWIKQWRADFHLYNMRRFREHFPDMTSLHVERVCGLPKSLIAVRNGVRGQ